MIKKYVALYLKIFLVFAIGIGIGIPLLTNILLGIFSGYSFNKIILFTYSFSKGTELTTLLVSIGGSILMATPHILRVRSLPTHEPENISPIQTRELVLPVNQNEAFKYCLSSLMLINAKVIQKDAPSRIKAKTPINFFSPDAEIEFTIRPITTSRTLVRFTSKPTWKTVILDFGANIENVEKIYWYLEEKFNLN